MRKTIGLDSALMGFMCGVIGGVFIFEFGGTLNGLTLSIRFIGGIMTFVVIGIITPLILEDKRK